MNRTVDTHYLDVPGAKIYYEVRGSGPLLALIGHRWAALASWH